MEWNGVENEYEGTNSNGHFMWLWGCRHPGSMQMPHSQKCWSYFFVIDQLQLFLPLHQLCTHTKHTLFIYIISIAFHSIPAPIYEAWTAIKTESRNGSLGSIRRISTVIVRAGAQARQVKQEDVSSNSAQPVAAWLLLTYRYSACAVQASWSRPTAALPVP